MSSLRFVRSHSAISMKFEFFYKLACFFSFSLYADKLGWILDFDNEEGNHLLLVRSIYMSITLNHDIPTCFCVALTCSCVIGNCHRFLMECADTLRDNSLSWRELSVALVVTFDF